LLAKNEILVTVQRRNDQRGELVKLAPIIIVGGVIIAGLVAWKMGLLPDSANKAIDQGRAAVEEKISGDEAAVVDTPKSDCDTLTPDACYNLGETYRYGNGVEADKARAARIFETACNGGASGGCKALADMYDTGDGVEQNGGLALSYYSKACSTGDFTGCEIAGGREYSAGNIDESTRLFAIGCDLGAAIHCYNVGENNTQLGKMTDVKEWYKKGCDLGDSESCDRLSSQ